MSRYILLVCTWLFVAATIVYLWVRHGLEPPAVLWFVLIVIALIPLAERLRIGNWIDFTRKVGKLGKELSCAQKEMKEISNRVDTLVTNLQSQQQFNVSLLSEEAARAFAQSFSLSGKADYPTDRVRKMSSADEDAFFSDKMSPTDRERFFFAEAADNVIASATPLLRIMYYAKMTRQKKKRVTAKVVLSKTASSMIEELQQDSETLIQGEGGNRLGDYLQVIGNLIKLNGDVYEMNVDPPSLAEWRKIRRDVGEALSFIEGMIAMSAAFALAPGVVLRIGNLRFLKIDDVQTEDTDEDSSPNQ